MTTKTTPAPATPAPQTDVPDAAQAANASVLDGVLAEPTTIEEMKAELTRLRAELSSRPAKPARAKNAADFRRDVDLAIIAYAGNLVAGMVPAEFQAEVGKLVANQLHHLSTPALGWPSENLPKPDRSDWR